MSLIVSFEVSFDHLAQLSSDSTCNCQTRMYIGKEAGRIRLNLLDVEVGTSIRLPIGTVQSRSERSLQAADRVGILLVADWIWESKSWWA